MRVMKRRDPGNRRLLPLLLPVRCATCRRAIAGDHLPGHTSMVRRDPTGIVGSIAPWNHPLMMMAWKLAPAIAGGNIVVFKPSEQTPLTALKPSPRSSPTFLPEGVVNVIARPRRQRRQCADQPPQDQHDLDRRRRRDRARRCCRRRDQTVKRTHLELGGKAPLIVFDDADIEAVVNGLTRLWLLQCRPGLHRRLPNLCRRRKSTSKLVADLTAAASTSVIRSTTSRTIR